MQTLKNFLTKRGARGHAFNFAKDLTLEQFLETCPRGDWILALFQKTNPNSLRELTLAKGHCANTVRHLMKDERSIKAVDVAIAFGKNKATLKKLEAAAHIATAYSVTVYDTSAAVYAAVAASYAATPVVAAACADATAYAAAAATNIYALFKKNNQQLTADICRKYLSIDLWDQSKF